jgi:H+/Cl- antiporter ClcA
VTGLLLVKVIDTAGVILDAILWWIVAIALGATVVVFAVVLTGAWAWRAVRRGHAPASRPHSPSCGSLDAEISPSPAGGRTGPSWAHTEHEHQEAA